MWISILVSLQSKGRGSYSFGSWTCLAYHGINDSSIFLKDPDSHGSRLGF